MMPSSLPSVIPSSCPSGVPSTTPSIIPSIIPSAVPTFNPSVIPSGTPSGIPTAIPSSIPSSLPSSNPSTSPSSIPSQIPSTMPTDTPQSFPSSDPTIIPSLVPSMCPSGLPSVLPSSVPTFSPTSLPSSTPSTLPTFLPTSHPSCMPSCVPSTAPTSIPTNPSSAPSSVPTFVPSNTPTAIPSGQPSGQPSCQPTGAPTGQPTGGPTSQPTSSPTVDVCSAGYYRNIYGVCEICPPGSYSLQETTQNEAYSCTLCPPGSYTAVPGSGGCVLCPLSTYGPEGNSTSETGCLQCPSGRTTPFEGAAFESDCLTPAPNFIMGFIGLAVAIVITIVYIVRGRFHRVSFLREERVVNPIKKEVCIADKALTKMIVNVDQRKNYYFPKWHKGVVLGPSYTKRNAFRVKYSFQKEDLSWWRSFRLALLHCLSPVIRMYYPAFRPPEKGVEDVSHDQLIVPSLGLDQSDIESALFVESISTNEIPSASKDGENTKEHISESDREGESHTTSGGTENLEENEDFGTTTEIGVEMRSRGVNGGGGVKSKNIEGGRKSEVEIEDIDFGVRFLMENNDAVKIEKNFERSNDMTRIYLALEGNSLIYVSLEEDEDRADEAINPLEDIKLPYRRRTLLLASYNHVDVPESDTTAGTIMFLYVG